MAPLLEMRGISKAFGAVRANRQIDLSVGERRIVGLLGENGSGKTTLMRVLFGMVRPDAGTITFKGRPLINHSPGQAIAVGMGMIHQHFTLVEAMTVVENIMLGWERAGRWLKTTEVAAEVKAASGTYRLGLDPFAVIGDLPLGLRQRVEIVKAILRGADLLILDEPTSSLSPPEVRGLLDVLRRLRDEGRAVIFISHKLGEVLDVCDEVVVLRDGEVVGRRDVAGASRHELARLMVGREVAEARGGPARAAGPEQLSVSRLTVHDGLGVARLRDVTFSVRGGEILAIAGVDGNGQAELADALAGLVHPSRGTVRLNGIDVTAQGPSARVRAGLAYIPADRSTMGLVPDMAIADNLALRDFDRPPLCRGPWLDVAAFRGQATARIAAFDIRAARPSAAVRTLSGGNQQKVVLAREIGRCPSVLLAVQPTRGLDPGATRFVTDQLLALRDAGVAIVYISSELEEVLAVGDRVAVLHGGRLVGLAPRDEVDVTRIGLLMAGVTEEAEPRR